MPIKRPLRSKSACTPAVTVSVRAAFSPRLNRRSELRGYCGRHGFGARRLLGRRAEPQVEQVAQWIVLNLHGKLLPGILLHDEL